MGINERFLLCCVFVVGACTGCAPQMSVSPTADAGASRVDEPRQIATTNYTPFSSVVGAGLTEDGRNFIGAALKVSFDEAKDAESPLSQQQPRFAPNGSIIDELPPFRAQAEVYLATSGAPIKSGTFISNDRKVPLSQTEWVSDTRNFGLVALVPYLEPNDIFTVSTGKSTLTFAIPPLFAPFVLPRYESGAMMPTPLRADTIVIDLDSRRMSVIYRSTLPAEPPLRKIEFRLITDPIEPWANHTLAATRAKFMSQQRYLLSCPVPKTPIEECALPGRRVAPEFFG
jgi:hypothetical protein